MNSPTSIHTTIDQYLAAQSPTIQKILERVRQTIQAGAPEATEMINYGIPTFKINHKNLVHFAVFKKHVGFYPAPSGITAFAKELAPYKSAKGSVQFPLDQPIPYELIKKIVKFRVKENRQTRT